MLEKESKLTAKRILSDFKKAFEYKKKWIDEARQDIEFALGKQWKEESISELETIGVQPLTINKIHSIILGLTGLESQNRTDYHAFPKGEEDGIKAEVTTSLLKHVMDISDGEYKQSEQFDEGVMSGECYLEPFIDYADDIINGQLRWKKVSATQVFASPKFMEYDVSDASYVIKFSPGLSKDDVLSLYPDQEKKIKNIAVTKVDTLEWNNLKAEVEFSIQKQDNYQNKGENQNGLNPTEGDEEYDLIEYYYKKQVKKPYVIDMAEKRLVMVEDEQKAVDYVSIANEKQPGSAEIRYRYCPEIWMGALIGNTILYDGKSWTYPRWKNYPLIPYFAYRRTADIKNSELLIKGVVRDIKDLNRDLNKRRTQELRHLNQSANSGWQMEENSVDPNDEDAYRKFGATPGVVLKYKQGRTPPQKILPTPLSQGHVQIANERAQEIKEVSGYNSDLLAQNESQASGRAIHLRTKQGLVMVQKIFDNNSRTKKLMGRFILSQLGEVFDVESAMKVMGDKWVLDNFGMPVMQPQVDPYTGMPMIDPMTGQPVMAPVIDPATGKPQLEMTPEAQQKAQEAMNIILNDPNLSKYDVAVGEGVASDTIKFANFMILQELAQSGIPIPPDVLIEESTLSGGMKDKIKAAFQQQAQAALPQPAGKAKQ